MLNVCGTNVRLIASVLTVFEDRCFRFHFDDTVGALVARYRLGTKFVKNFEEHFSLFSKREYSFGLMISICACGAVVIPHKL